MTTRATDSFDRANNADLGTAWDVNISSFKIDTNNAKNAAPTSADSAERNNTITWPNDQWSESTLGSVTAGQGGSNGYGAAVRMDTGGAANFYNVFGNNLGWNIARMDAGANTTLASGASPAFATGDVIYLEMVGSQPTAKRNGTALGSPGTDSTYSAGSAGVYCSGDGGMSVNDGIDSWQGGDFLSASTSVSGPFQAHGAGQGPMLRRRMLQQYPTPAPVDTVTPAPQIQPPRGYQGLQGPARRRLPQQFPDTIIPPPSPGGPTTVARGPGGIGPRLRRMFPQTFPTPGIATINAGIGKWTWAGLSTTLVTIIAAAVGSWTWSGKTSSLMNIVPAKVGAWTWSGVQAPLTPIVAAKVGAWTWAGAQSSLTTLVSAKIGAWTWAGVHAGVSTGGAINATVGTWTWSGVQSPLMPIISAGIGNWLWSGVNAPLAGQVVPTPPTGSGGGGRYFGYYPERAQELRAEIRSIIKEKKRIERRFKLAPNNVDLARLAALLTELQQRLNALIAEYEELTHVWQAETRSAKAQEEDEEFLVNLFSQSFYND